MIWRHHRLVSAAIVFSATGHIFPSVITYYSAVFPDSIEGHDYDSYSWKRNHRKYSHTALFYALPLMFLYFYFGGLFSFFPTPEEFFASISESLATKDPTGFIDIVLYCSIWFFVGCLLHIAEDFFCGGVPLIFPKRRVGIRIFYVKTFGETIFSYLLILLALSLRYFNVEPFFIGF